MENQTDGENNRIAEDYPYNKEMEVSKDDFELGE